MELHGDPPLAAPPVDVSVIICAFDMGRWPLLAQAVAAIEAQTHPARELILVVDGNDELRKRAAAELPGATVLSNVHERGLSGARRTGAEAAGAPVLAFIDDDAIAEPDWLRELVAAYEDPSALGVGGDVAPMWLEAEPAWLPPEFYWVVGCTYEGLESQDGRIRNPIGANMSVRSDVLARAGSFDSRLGRANHGTPLAGTAEETEFCIRAARLHPGRYWVYRPAARVRHAVPRERTTWRYFVRRCRVEGTAKAVLTGITGESDGLASERDYVRSAIPRGLARELRAGARGDARALRRAAALIAGVAVTGFWYAVERVRRRFSKL